MSLKMMVMGVENGKVIKMNNKQERILRKYLAFILDVRMRLNISEQEVYYNLKEQGWI